MTNCNNGANRDKGGCQDGSCKTCYSNLTPQENKEKVVNPVVNQEMKVVNKEWRERFNKFWPSISIGYDGSEADAMKRDSVMELIATLLANEREKVVEILGGMKKEFQPHWNIGADQIAMSYNQALTAAISAIKNKEI